MMRTITIKRVWRKNRMDRKQRDKCSSTFSYKKVIKKKTVLQDWKRGQMLYSEKEKATFIL